MCCQALSSRRLPWRPEDRKLSDIDKASGPTCPAPTRSESEVCTFFQLLSQALVLRQRALQLPLQRFRSPLEFLLPIRGATAMRRLHPFDDAISLRICSAPCLNTLCLLSRPLVNIVAMSHRAA